MSIVNKTLLLAASAALLLSNTVQPNIVTLTVLKDKNTGNIVRLAGDLHSHHKKGIGVVDQAEKTCMQNIAESLSDYLNNGNPEKETFVVECGQATALEELTHKGISTLDGLLEGFSLYQKAKKMTLKTSVEYISKMDPFGLSLMLRLVLIGLPNIPKEIKSIVSSYENCTLKPNIKVTAYDLRGNKLAILLELALQASAIKKSKKLFNLARLYFKEFITTQLNQKYDTEFAEFMKKEAENLMNDLETLQKQFEKDPSNKAIIDDLSMFSCKIADFGFLSSIGRARTKGQNITLYAGAAHSQIMKKALPMLGYEVIFDKGDLGFDPYKKDILAIINSIKKVESSRDFSQEDYAIFFTCTNAEEASERDFLQTCKEEELLQNNDFKEEELFIQSKL